MVRIKLGGVAMNAMRDTPMTMVAKGKACGATAIKLVNADVVRGGAARAVEAEGRRGLAGKAALGGKAALARGGEAEGARLVAMTKATPLVSTAKGAKAVSSFAMAAPSKVVVTKAAATSAGLLGTGVGVGLGLGAGALGPLLAVGALCAVGVGIYVGVRHERS